MNIHVDIDGIEVSKAVVEYIKTQYPNYKIDDVDRDVCENQTYYDIELEHNDQTLDDDVELHYDSQWNLIRTTVD